MFDISLKYFRLINYIIAAALLVTSLLLARTIITISYSSPKTTAHPSEEKARKRTVKKSNIQQYAPILEKNPFGPPLELRPVIINAQKDTVPKSATDLTLVGTAVGSEHSGYAIFIDRSNSSKKEEEVFKHGQQVYGYGKLVKIEKEYVELERDSEIYTIEIIYDGPKEKKKKSRLKKTGRSKTSSKKTFAKKVGEGSYILDSRKVQQSLANPERLLTDARLLPVIKEGKQEGFKISEVVPNGMYHSLGLKNGDTLLKINGLEISNPEVAIQAMSALKGMSSIDLDIIRDGSKMSLNYQIR